MSSKFGRNAKIVETGAYYTSCSHNISCFPKLPLTFLQFNSNHRKFLVLKHSLVMPVKKYHAHLIIPRDKIRGNFKQLDALLRVPRQSLH